MKKAFLIIAGISCLSATYLLSIYDSLDITEEKTKEYLLGSIGFGTIQKTGEITTKARSLSVESQVAGIRQLITIAKEYSQTEDFKKDYKKWRNNTLNPNTKTKLGIPKLGKIIENKIHNQVDKAENEKKYPSDPQALIKKRLEDFLRISATVDFDAELDGGRAFKNPEYEKKSNNWKMCYRAGREVIAAARQEAQKWLDDLKEE